ncbi:hypothetical protein TSAR_008269 [Trichomalopsis sarcophagae]|uniref:Lipid-binding serum glycoprotein N-terminal domain-containing protein n=1 Tax=Trichomalopsis sarcophagae TaxID=543379 RepID=A0A232FET3_9HYME|nr:hypothetical protein TSAR_008269 [Trichomalopsis sarcophagae]
MNMQYDRKHLAVYEYCDTNAVNFLINKTAVTFSGCIIHLNNNLHSVALKTSKVLDTQIAGTAQLMSTVNILVDLSIAEIVRKVKEENQGTIKIPDINQRFIENSIWKPHGEFDAIDGIFSDLTTLSRTEDAHSSHDGPKFVASCGFGLSKANIHYKKYKLKYGVKVSGELSVTIDGIAMALSAAVDYNQKPCRVILQDLRLTKLGLDIASSEIIVKRCKELSFSTMFLKYFVLAIISLSKASVLCTEWIDCGPAKSFEVELGNNQKIFVYDSEIQVKYDRNELAVYEYTGHDNVNVLINNTLITFTGHIVPEREEFNPNALKTSKVFHSKIAGSAKLMKTKLNDLTLADCNLYLSRKRNEEELNIPAKLQVEIIHEAALCVKSIICQRLGVITSEDMKKARDHPFDFGRLTVTAANNHVEESKSVITTLESNNKPKFSVNDIRSFLSTYTIETNDVSRDVQSTINKLVDLAIAELVKKLNEENQGKIKIPDLDQNFSTGSSWWETTGEFNAYEGTFEDLTTLSRTEDAVLAHKGLKFTASCGFGLSKANMEYQKYKLRYGIIKVNGKLSASVDGVSLAATVGVDYNQKPCRAVLDSLRVSQLGKVKVKLTGLGPLNNLLSKLVTWITKKWQDDIVKVVEKKLMDIVVKNLDKFNCEKFRP